MYTEYLTQHVPEETARMILMFPIIVTLIAFIRQVIGIKAFGIYTPSLITFAFLAMGESGAKYGIAIFVSVIFVGMVTRFVLRKFRLLYFPRVAINLSIVAFSILGLLILGDNYQRTGLASVSIFPILI
ncbi:7TM domain-containing protein, partial [Patescibacteria group bacterium]